MAQSATGQRIGDWPPSRRTAAGQRSSIRPRGMRRAMAVRRSSRQESTAVHYALGTLGLLVALLLAFLPAHTSIAAPAPTMPEQGSLADRAITDHAEHAAPGAPLSISNSHGARQGAAPALQERASEDAPATVDDPPALAWYQLAAAEQGVSSDLLRALHHVESNAAPDGCIANLEGSGATGPFQFKPATFQQYGVDANHDGHRDICSFADALHSAASYLRALGVSDLDAPETRRALARYGTDPERVLALARSYRDRAASAR